ncbi:MAG: hypothetical protein RIT14_2876, partial [Pseudomonadota bacterium]
MVGPLSAAAPFVPQPDAPQPDPAPVLGPVLGPVLAIWLRLTVGLIALGVLSILFGDASYLPARFLLEQDAPMALVGAVCLALAVAFAPRLAAKMPTALPTRLPAAALLHHWPRLIAAACAGLAWVGAWAVFDHFPLSMDEFWAVSDGQA